MNLKSYEQLALEILFDQKKREVVVSPSLASDHADERVMLGYTTIRKIESLNINEISFGESLENLSNMIESLLLLSKKDFQDYDLNFLAGSEKSLDYSQAISAINLYKILHQSDKIKMLHSEIAIHTKQLEDSLSQLKDYVSELNQVILENSNPQSDEMRVRVSMLQNIETFQNLRVLTIVNHIDTSHRVLNNVANYLSFMLPNIIFSLQTKIKNLKITEVFQLIVHDQERIKLKIRLFQKNYQTKFKYFLGFMAFLSCYGIVGCMKLDLAGSFSFLIFSVALCFIIFLLIKKPDAGAIHETSDVFYSYSLSGVFIILTDIYLLDTFLFKAPVFCLVALITTACLLTLFIFLCKSKLKKLNLASQSISGLVDDVFNIRAKYDHVKLNSYKAHNTGTYND